MNIKKIAIYIAAAATAITLLVLLIRHEIWVSNNCQYTGATNTYEYMQANYCGENCWFYTWETATQRQMICNDGSVLWR